MKYLRKIKLVYTSEGFTGVFKRFYFKLTEYSKTKKILKIYLPSKSDKIKYKKQQAEFSYRPKISIILPVYDPSIIFLKEAINSVIEQIYDNWELCIADDFSSNPQIKQVLDEYNKKEQRIKVVYREKNGHICNASNSAISLASGEFIALLDHDDKLPAHALYRIVKELNQDRNIDFLYSNEDKIDVKNRHTEVHFKPCWSPEYLLSFMYIGHLAVYRKSLVDKVGRFRVGYEGSQDYDLALRVTEITDRVMHVPDILYHWRKHPGSVASDIKAKPYAVKIAEKVLSEALIRRGLTNAKVTNSGAKNIAIYNINMPINSASSILCLTKKEKVLINCSVNLRHVEFENILEIDSIIDRSNAEYLFFASKNLATISVSHLNDLIGYLQLSNVGAVSPKIVSNKRIVSGGITYKNSKGFNNFYNLKSELPGYGAKLWSSYNVSVIPHFCFVTPLKLFKQSSLRSADFASYKDLVLAYSMYLHNIKYRIVWTSSVALESEDVFPKVIKYYSKFNSYFDSFYPKGLERKQFSFEVDL